MEKQTVTLEGAKLKQIADRNDTAQVIMLSLADRKRFRSVTDISHMKNLLIQEGEKIVLEDYMKTWKELEALGVGSVIFGRNGKPHRFKWNYSLKTVGQAAMSGKSIEVKALRVVKSGSKKTQEKTSKPQIKRIVQKSADTQENVNNGVTNVVYIPLRTDFVFDVKIPQLSQKEADTICAAILRCI